MISSNESEFVLFIQHGWHDESKSFQLLANSLANSKTKIIMPNLGYVNTWLNIDNLIKQIENELLETLTKYPNHKIRIIAHSLGGCIWVELLNLYQELLPKIDSLILLGSPIGGADLARIVDPFGVLPTIAKDLAKNRRHLAEKIAQKVSILVITGNKDNGSDGTVIEGATLIKGAKFISLSGLNHRDLRNHCLVIETIKKFWQGQLNLSEIKTNINDEREKLITILRQVKGMTDAHYRDFKSAQIYHTLSSGLKLKIWKNPAQVDHVFLADQNDHCLYAGFVGWLHRQELQNTLNLIKLHY